MKPSFYIVTWRDGGGYGPFASAHLAQKWAVAYGAIGWSIKPVYAPLEREKA